MRSLTAVHLVTALLVGLAGMAIWFLLVASPPGHRLLTVVTLLVTAAAVAAIRSVLVRRSRATSAAAARDTASATVCALVDSAPDGIVVVDGGGRVELVNAHAARLWGLDREALAGQPLSRLVPSAAAVRELQRGQAAVDVALRRRDGTEVPVELSGHPVDGDDRLIVIVRDASERQRGEVERADRLRAEVARAHAEETGQRASFLAEASRVLAGSLDDEATLKSMARVAVPYLADYVVVDVLDAERRLRRLGAAHVQPELEGTLTTVRPCALEPGGESALAGVIERGEPTLVREVTDDWLAARPRDAEHLGGSALRPASLMLVPLRARGRTLGVVTFARAHGTRRYALADLAIAEDLAQRAALASDNARLFREAQDASRAKDEFLAVLSHELRTPLTPVLGWVRMLRAGTLKPEATGRALETVERNTRLQMQLVEDLLDVSRIVTGKLHLDVRPVALGDVVEAATEAVAAAAQQKSITVSRRVEPEVPIVEADPNRLQQVVANLLSNAVKFTPEGGRVDVVVALDGPHAQITVTDTGEGLLPDVAPHIFDRFRQADSTITRQYGGLGLGLAIVRHIVELHGGTVDAASEGPGRGTTITVRVPVARSPVAGDVGAATRRLASDVIAGALRDLRVLVVDDEYDARELLAAVLEAAGAAVTVVASADEALRALAKQPADVLLSDLAMPQRDGYELMRAARERGLVERLATIALSAQARPEDRQRALAAGFDSHVAKPVEPEAIVAEIRRLMHRPLPDS
jgi:PAS domain S-box-containing protein